MERAARAIPTGLPGTVPWETPRGPAEPAGTALRAYRFGFGCEAFGLFWPGARGVRRRR